VKMPPAIGTAIRFITSDPAPVANRIGISPQEHGRNGHKLRANVSRQAVHDRFPQLAAAGEPSPLPPLLDRQVDTMNIPVSASTPISAIIPTHTPTLML
jgi:hypothetical protein